MTDIVERLRAMAQGEARSGIGRQRRDLFEEAADEIERLRAALAELHEYAASVWFDEARCTDEEQQLMHRSKAAFKQWRHIEMDER